MEKSDVLCISGINSNEKSVLLEKMEEKLGELMEINKNFEKSNMFLSNDNVILRTNNEKLKSKNNEQIILIEKLENDLKQAKSLIKTLNNKLSFEKQQNKILKGKMQQIIEHADQNISGKTKHLSTLLEKKSIEEVSYKTEINNLKESIQQKERNNNEKQEKIEELQNRISMKNQENEKCKKELLKYQSENSNLKEQILQLQDQNQKMVVSNGESVIEISKLRNDNIQISTKLEKYKNKSKIEKENFTKISKICKKAKIPITSFDDFIFEAKKAFENSMNYFNELQQTKTELSLLKETIHENETSIFAATHEKNEISEKHKNLKKAVRTQKKQIDLIKKYSHFLYRTNQSLSALIDQTRMIITSNESPQSFASIINIVLTIQSLSKRIFPHLISNPIQKDLPKLAKKALFSLDSQRLKAISDSELLQNNIQLAKKKVDEATERMTILIKEKSDLINQIKNLQSQLAHEKVNQQNMIKSEIFEDEKRKNDEFKSIISHLKETILSQETTIQNLKQELLIKQTQDLKNQALDTSARLRQISLSKYNVLDHD